MAQGRALIIVAVGRELSLLLHDEENDDAEIAQNHTESNIEADVHAKDQLKDELMDDIEANSGAKAMKKEKQRVSPTASNAEEEGTEEEGEEDDDEEAYEVEQIIDHEWRKNPGKGAGHVLLYNVKWKGYDASENTLEPEENLLSSRDLLAAYHHKLGGAPQPPTGPIKSKRSHKSLRNEATTSAAEESPAPPSAKRQKKTKEEDLETSDNEAAFGSWVPQGNNWDGNIKAIETVERDQESKDLYILLLFKNGKKSRVKNNVMRKKAPQSLLDFYEAHLSV